jgi:signal peptidase I
VIIVERPGEDGTWPAPPSGPVGRRQWVIKRVAAVPGEPRPGNCPPASADSPERLVPAGKLVLLGDNPAWSYDSREFGYFPSDRLLGVVVLRVSRGVVPGISA